MGLCALCKSIDFVNLLLICLSQCQKRQQSVSKRYKQKIQCNSFEDDLLSNQDEQETLFEVKHHGDIFEIEKSSEFCDLCKIIFQAFKRKNIENVEDARGLPIVFCAFRNKIEVCYRIGTRGGPTLCALDTYMNEPDVVQLFQTGEIREDNSPPLLKIMDSDPVSKKSFAIASSWLRNCLENHSFCKPPGELQKPPKRLINVGNETQNPFLIETLPDFQQVEWLSLSYCWGGEPSMKLTKDTMEVLKNGIPLMNFDATIRDAILVTRALGISYIWIDALCIKQEPDEWSREASKMNEAYGGSVVTLVIASSDSVKNGFLKERELNYVPVAYSRDLAEDFRARVFLSPEWDESERECDEPWRSRGWTMQEGLLPSRLLHYTASQIIWKCGMEQRFERGITDSFKDRLEDYWANCGYEGFLPDSEFLWQLPKFLRFKRFKDEIPDVLNHPIHSRANAFRLWYDLIEDYTPRRFTNFSDRLLAFSGVAREYSSIIQNATYVAGLWKEDLMRGLLWRTNGAQLVRRQRADNISTSQNAFPSWSWACAGYEVIENDLKRSNDIWPIAEIESVQIDLVNPEDPFGAVKSARIIINGPLRNFPRLYNKEWKSAETTISELERCMSRFVERESQGCVEQEYSSPPGGHFAVLLMLQDLHAPYLLVLEATGETLNGINTYRRIGILSFAYVDPKMVASPSVVAVVAKMNNSLSARLSGPKKAKVRNCKGPRFHNAVYMELVNEKWIKKTIMLV